MLCRICMSHGRRWLWQEQRADMHVILYYCMQRTRKGDQKQSGVYGLPPSDTVWYNDTLEGTRSIWRLIWRILLYAIYMIQNKSCNHFSCGQLYYRCLFYHSVALWALLFLTYVSCCHASIHQRWLDESCCQLVTMEGWRLFRHGTLAGLPTEDTCTFANSLRCQAWRTFRSIRMLWIPKHWLEIMHKWFTVRCMSTMIDHI